jgi:hypothetical protein
MEERVRKKGLYEGGKWRRAFKKIEWALHETMN